MKQYTTGLITGALLAISAMMFMGANSNVLNVGRFVQMDKFKILDTTNGSVWHSGIAKWNEDGEEYARPGWTEVYESVFESKDLINVVLGKGLKHMFQYDN